MNSVEPPFILEGQEEMSLIVPDDWLQALILSVL